MKSPDQIFSVDKRSDFADTGSIIQFLSAFTINKAAPEGCHRALRIAGHSLLYSHFHYELIMPASFYCYQALDYGVKQYTKDEKTSLSQQIKSLVKRGVLAKSNFKHTLSISPSFPLLSDSEFVEHVGKFMVKFRNSHAHSANMLYPSYRESFPMSVDVVNQLFP